LDGVGVAVLIMDLTMLIKSGGLKFWSDGCVVLAVGVGLYVLGMMLVVAIWEGNLWVSACIWGSLLSRGTLLDRYRASSVGTMWVLALLDGTSDLDSRGDSVSALFKLLHSPKMHSATPMSGC
jgi:hypothetical protein